MRVQVILSLILLTLSGCQSLMISGAKETAMAVAEDRSLESVVDDASIYTEINHYFVQTDVRDLFPNVSVAVRQGRVLLTGKVNSEATSERATQEAWRAAGVKEVINEIEVQPDSTIFNRAQDEWIEKNLEGRLTITKGVNILNYSVEVCNSTVYLLGTVTSEQELNTVLQVARVIRGVRRVVSHLRLPNANPQPVQEGF